jgi:hypothetical protein
MTDIHVIILHLVRCRAVIERCANVIKDEDFNGPGEDFLGMLWKISRGWCAKHKGTIPKEYMYMEVNTELQPVHQEFSNEELLALFGLVDWIYEQPEDTLILDFAMERIQVFLDNRRVKPLAAELADATSDVFKQALVDMQTEHNKTRLTARGKIDNIFTPTNFYIGKTARQPTGVSFVDELFNGGTAPGELYGLIAPTGGGKTTLGAMLFAEFAKQRRHTAYFSYETEFAPQVTNSIYCYMAGLPRGALDRASRDELDPEHREAIEAALTEYGNWMHGFDMKKETSIGVGCGGVPEIATNLQMHKNRGESIELLIIDQMLSLVDSYIAREAKGIENRRVHMQLFTEEIRQLTSEFNCCALILHQADNAFKKAPPYRKPAFGYAAEDKSFENNMHFCLGMGTRDKDSRMSWLSAIKHREGPGGDLVIEMDDKIPRLNWDKERFRYDASTKSFIKMLDDEHDTSRDLSSARDADTYKPKKQEKEEESSGLEPMNPEDM